MKTRSDLMAMFADLGLETTTFDHPPVFTVAESKDIKAKIPGGHTKNLFVKDKKDNVFLIVAEGDAAIDLKRVHEKIGAQGRVSFGKPELLLELMGLTPGSVTPFGVINDTGGRIKVVLDAAMMEHEVLNYHPLLNDATTSIKREDLVRFLKATGHDPMIILVSDGKLPQADEDAGDDAGAA
jgi:Ala-tRNA(Pro) deacylase